MTTITASDLREVLPSIQRFALKLTRNEDRANDLVQDSIERALNKAHLFDGSNLRSWLFTVTRRVFLNQIRREKSRGIPVDIDDAPQQSLSNSASQEINMHFKDVANNFAQLPLNDKVILSLVVIEGLSYEEAAVALDIPVGTVRSRLSRARSRLLDMINVNNDETFMAASV